MKILIISNIFPPGFVGGYELAALDIAKELYNEGHEIQVLTSNYFLDDREKLKFLNISRTLLCAALVHELTPQDCLKQQYYNFQNIRILGSTIRRFKPDIVLTFNLSELGPLSIIQYLQNISIPTILYLMDNIFLGLDYKSQLHQHYEKIFGQFKLNHSTRVIAMSENLTREVNETLNLTLENVTYIPGWVDFQQHPRQKIVLHNTKITHFIFCSRIAPHKGIEIMIDTAEQLVQQGLTQFIIDVYGPGHVTFFLQKVKSKNLEKYIQYKGVTQKHEMLSILSKYDALLFPTWQREAFGFIASEAAAAGCFPIITIGIGASEWFLDGYDCFKIFRDVQSLATAMQRVMLWSDEEKAKKCHNALISARKNFEFNRWSSTIKKICLEMAATQKIGDYDRATKGVESAFLFLNSLLSSTSK